MIHNEQNLNRANKMTTLHPWEIPCKNLTIKKTNTSDGKWVIRLSNARFQFFWTKKEAQKWLKANPKNQW